MSAPVRFCMILLAALVLSIHCVEARAERLAHVGSRSLGVHESASGDSPRVTVLMAGQKVLVVSESDGWCGIEHEGGGELIGYVRCDKLMSSPTVADKEKPSYDGPNRTKHAPSSARSSIPAVKPGPRPYSDVTVRLYMTGW